MNQSVIVNHQVVWDIYDVFPESQAFDLRRLMASENLQTSPSPTTRTTPPASAFRRSGAAPSSGPASGRSAEGMELVVGCCWVLRFVGILIHFSWINENCLVWLHFILDKWMLFWLFWLHSPGPTHGLPPRVNSDDSSSNNAKGEAKKEKNDKKSVSKKEKNEKKPKKAPKKKHARDDDDTEAENDADHAPLGKGRDENEDPDDSDGLGSEIPEDLREPKDSKKKPAAAKTAAKKRPASRRTTKRGDKKESLLKHSMFQWIKQYHTTKSANASFLKSI